MTNSLESNIYQDGRWVVVPVEDPVFPARCIKTNAPVKGTSYVFEADLLRNQLQVPKSGGEQAAQAAARVLFGKVGGAAVDLMSKRRLKFNIGLSDEREALAKKRWRLGIAFVIVGPILAVVLGAGAAQMTERMNGSPSLPLAIAGGTVGMLLMVAGIVLCAMASRSTLIVIRSDGKYVWLEGACDDFRASLPESPEKWKPRG